MDPARPDDIDPADPFSPSAASQNQPAMETIEIATEGEDCDECVRKLREPLMKIAGVSQVKAEPERNHVVITFDARKTHAPDLHDAILASGYKPGSTAS